MMSKNDYLGWNVTQKGYEFKITKEKRKKHSLDLCHKPPASVHGNNNAFILIHILQELISSSE